MSVNVNHCCTKKSLRQSFQVKKSQNNQCYLNKYLGLHTELMQNNNCNKYIELGRLNCHEVIFLQIFILEFDVSEDSRTALQRL